MSTETEPQTPVLVATPTPPQRNAETGRFLPGHVGFGRGLNGRSKAIRTLDAMLATEGNQQKLRVALQAAFDKNPIRFFRDIIMPLLPKETRMEMASEGKVLWTRISEAFPPQPEESEAIDAVAVQL